MLTDAGYPWQTSHRTETGTCHIANSKDRTNSVQHLEDMLKNVGKRG